MKKTAITCLAAVPVIIVGIFIHAAFIHGNPGFKLDKTQAGLLISGIFLDVNDVREGDTILAVYGLSHHEIMGYGLGLFKKGDDQDMTVLRDGKTIRMPLKTSDYSILSLCGRIWPVLILIAVFIILGTIALHRAPPGPAPTLFFLMLCSLSVSLSATIPSAMGLLTPTVFSAAFLLQAVSNWFSFGLWAHFSLRFPEHRDMIRNRWWIPAAIYLLPAATTIIGSLAAAGTTPEFFGWVQRLRNLYLPLIIFGVFIKHAIDFIKTKDTQGRNRIKLPLIAYWLTFAPYMFFYLIPNLIWDAPLISFRVVVFAFFFLPLAYLLAILKYRLFNVDQIISRTMAYFTVIIGLSVIYSLFLAVLKKWFFGEQVLSKELFLLFLIFVNILFHPLILRLDRLIRKFFFREQSISAKLMHRFSNRISATLNLKDLVHLVVNELPPAIHLQSAAIMTLEESRSRLFPDHLRFGTTPWLDSRIVHRFNTGNADFFSSRQDTDDPILSDELKEIRQNKFSLVLPLKGSHGLSALLFLGDKQSGRPFNEEDIHLLASFANQAGTALENAIHHETLAKSKKQLEEMFDQKVRSEKMAAIGEMTSLLAHELKNPLGIIHSSAQYLAEKEQPKEITKEMLHYILSEVDHLNLSINSILKLARQKTPEFIKIDFKQQTERLVEQWLRSKTHKPFVEIFLDVAPLPEVYADFSQISQVLLNLIRNSEEMMPHQGSIRIHVTHRENTIHIQVHDNGPGIPEDHLDKVFNNFFTTKETGLGLGLAASRQIIQAHNGTIGIDNHPDGGAIATVCIPAAPLATVREPKLQQAFQFI